GARGGRGGGRDVVGGYSGVGVRERDPASAGAVPLQKADGVAHCVLDLRVEPGHEVFVRDAEGEALDPSADSGLVVGYGLTDGGRVQGVGAGDGLEQARRVAGASW